MRRPMVRHERALDHLNQIRQALHVLKAEYVNDVPAYLDPQSGEHYFREPLKQPRLEIILRAGELLYNLRAAIDHFTFALAFYHSGHVNEKAQFPIEHKPKFFQKRRETFL